VGGGGLYSALVTACVEAALGGDTQASAALRPGGAMDNTVINRVARANFPANPPPPPPPNDDLQRLLNAFAALQAALDALRNLGF
jgi:hypothetical protein